MLVEVFPQLDLEAAAILSRAGSMVTLPVVLSRARLVSHLLDKVLEAGDAHAKSLERRPLLVQADSLGRRVSSILQDLEATSVVSKLCNPALTALSIVDAAAASNTVEIAAVSSLPVESSDGLIAGSDGAPIDGSDGESNDGLTDGSSMVYLEKVSQHGLPGKGVCPQGAGEAARWLGARVLRQEDNADEQSPECRAIPGEKGGAPSQCKRDGLRARPLSKTKPTLQSGVFILYTVGESIPTADRNELQGLLDQFHSEEAEVD